MRDTHHAGFGVDLQFGIKLEGPARHHPFTFLQSAFHDIIIIEARAEVHFAAFVGRFFPVRNFNIDDGTLAGFQGGRDRDDERGVFFHFGYIAQRLCGDERHAADIAAAGLVLDHFGMHRADPLAGQGRVHHPAVLRHFRAGDGADKHAGLEFHRRIFNNHTYLGGAGGGMDDRVDERDGARKGFSRIGFSGEFDVAAVAQPLDIAFIGVKLDPDPGKIGDGIDLCAGLYILAFLCVLVDDDAAGGRIDGHVVAWGTARFNPCNLLCGEAPQPEFFTDGFDGLFRGIEQHAALAVLEVFQGLYGLDQLLLCGEQFGAVELSQMVAFPDRDAGVVHEQAIDPAGHPGGDVGYARFIVVDFSGHLDFRRHETANDFDGFEFHQLGGIRADADFALAAFVATGYKRNEIHEADRAFTGFGQLDLRMHRAGPDRGLRFGVCGLRLLCRRCR